MPIKLSLTQRAHILISANHRMERFSKNDSWVIFNKITSSSMTLSEGNHHSCPICLANERYFHIKSFSGKIFSAIYISLIGLMHLSMSSPRGVGGRATHRNLTVTHIPRVGILTWHHSFDLSISKSRWELNHLFLLILTIIFCPGVGILIISFRKCQNPHPMPKPPPPRTWHW